MFWLAIIQAIKAKQDAERAKQEQEMKQGGNKGFSGYGGQQADTSTQSNGLGNILSTVGSAIGSGSGGSSSDSGASE